LFAALHALDGTVIGACMDKHRHEEFLKFLRTVDKESAQRSFIGSILSDADCGQSWGCGVAMTPQPQG
jgi:hypothetical protein